MKFLLSLRAFPATFLPVKLYWVLIGLFAGFAATATPSPSIYHDGWIDLNKDGKKEIYEDSSQPIPRRVNDLLKRMTLEEKIGQLWQVDTQTNSDVIMSN